MPIGNSAAFQTIAFVVISILCAYAGGRIHQWYRHTMDRDGAFRDGYNHGYRSLFHLATRRPPPAAESGGRDEHLASRTR